MTTVISETRRFVVPSLGERTLKTVLADTRVVWGAVESPGSVLDLDRLCSGGETEVILWRNSAFGKDGSHTSDVLEWLAGDGYEPEDLLAQLRLACCISDEEIDAGPILALGGELAAKCKASTLRIHNGSRVLFLPKRDSTWVYDCWFIVKKVVAASTAPQQ